MVIPLVMAAAYGSVLLVGAAIYTIQNSPGGTLRPGTRTPVQPAEALPQEFEGAIGDSDALDPLANGMNSTGNLSTANSEINDLKNTMSAEATQTCETCPICGFLTGSKGNASFPFLPAMDYQHRVSTMMGGGQPLLQFWPEIPRIEEWALADAASGNGRRNFDGFNMINCFLIEAKLGYGGYLGNNPVRLPTPEGKTMTSLPILDDATSMARIAAVATQMQRHHRVAVGYPIINYSMIKHHVFWFCSNQKLSIFCYATARANALSRIRVFYLPVGLLPASIWR